MLKRRNSVTRIVDDIDRLFEQNPETLASVSGDSDNSKNNGKSKKRKRDILEVEDSEQRLLRLQNLLENVDSMSPSSSTLRQSVPAPFHTSQLHSSKPHFVPRSKVLSRVEAFLPQLARSNAELFEQTQNDPTSVDIESITENQETHIEMNLGLGVFEKKRRRKSYDGSESDSASDSHSDSNGDDETHSSDSPASHSTSNSQSGSDTGSDSSDEALSVTSSSSKEASS